MSSVWIGKDIRVQLHALKAGNITLQAVGYYNGNYIFSQKLEIDVSFKIMETWREIFMLKYIFFLDPNISLRFIFRVGKQFKFMGTLQDGHDWCMVLVFLASYNNV